MWLYHIIIVLGAVSCLLMSAPVRAEDTASQEALRLDQLQVVGSHNSYHAGLEPGIRRKLEHEAPQLAHLLDYDHPSLSTQLDGGVRQLELDIYADSRGGKFAYPHRPGHPDEKWPLSATELALMRQPGFKVMHIPDIDQHANCQPLKACLQQIQSWSHAHPDHVPIFVILEIEQSNDIPGGTSVERFTPKTFDNLDDAILSVFKKNELLTPDDVRGHGGTLAETIRHKGWPTVAQTRGKVVFLLDQRDNSAFYLQGHPLLHNRVAFTNATPDASEAAFTELNDGPAQQITALVRRHLIVRARADVNTVEARDGSVSRRDTMLASGAQIVSTDYPDGEPARWTGYRVGFTGGGSVRCNPVTAPPGCISRGIEIGQSNTLQLRRVIMVMRHGIRSPLVGQEPEGTTIPGGWPRWDVAPGALTPHGAASMRTIGHFQRQWLDETGVVSGEGCPSSTMVSIYSNSEPRTIASADAFLNGFAPSCHIKVNHLSVGTPDRLLSALSADPDRFDMKAIVPQLPSLSETFAPTQKALAMLAEIVRCGQEVCGFLNSPNTVVPDETNHGLVLAGPIQKGSSIAEALMLAYLDGKPEMRLNGKIVDAAQLGTLSALHAAMLNSIVRPPVIGEKLSYDLRKRLVRDLSERSGPAFRLYVGHDDTIAPLLGLLQIHVQAPGYARDEIPVGSALGFAVYQDNVGNSLVRVFFQSQTPEALRGKLANSEPSWSFPVVGACRELGGLCTKDEILALLR